MNKQGSSVLLYIFTSSAQAHRELYLLSKTLCCSKKYMYITINFISSLGRLARMNHSCCAVQEFIFFRVPESQIGQVFTSVF